MPIHPDVAARFPLLDGLTSMREAYGTPAGLAQIRALRVLGAGRRAAGCDDPRGRRSRAARPRCRCASTSRRRRSGPGCPAWSGRTAGAFSAVTSTCARRTGPPARCAPGPAPSSSASTTGSRWTASATRCRTTTPSPRSPGCGTTPRRSASTPTRIAVGGASAGANLTAGAVLKLRDRDGWLPSALVFVYGVAHPVVPPPSPALAAALAELPPLLAPPPGSGTTS